MKKLVDKECLGHQRNMYNHLLTQAKQDSFKTQFEAAEISQGIYDIQTIRRDIQIWCYISACAADKQIWMSDNFLKLNDDKTEFLIITTREELRTMYRIYRPRSVISRSLQVMIHQET